MAKMTPQAIGTYVSDLGPEIDNLPFKLRAGFDDCITADFNYLNRTSNPLCSQSQLLKPRHLVAIFDAKPAQIDADGNETAPADPARSGAKIKFPVKDNSSATLQAMVTALKACGAVCIDYVGEYWKVVPPSLADYTVGTLKMVLPNDGQFADKRSGRCVYSSDVLGASTPANVAYEILPTELSSVINGCVGTLDESPLCEIVDIKPRHGIAKGAVDNALNPKASFSRKAFIASAESATIVNCLKQIGDLAFVQCVGYRGESVKRVDLLFS